MTSASRPPDDRETDARALLLRRRIQAATERRAVIGPRPPQAEGQPSIAQKALCFNQLLAPASTAYTIPVAVPLPGPVHRAALTDAVRALADRHETLRTRFPRGRDGQPTVHTGPSDELTVTELAACSPDELAGVLSEEASRKFDLARKPPLRVAVVPVGAQDCVLLVTVHHIACDGWSVDILVRDLLALYHAFVDGTTALLPRLPVSYADYTHWQHDQVAEGKLDQDVAYWRTQLAELPDLAPSDELPTPTVLGHAGDWHDFQFDAELTEAVTALGRAAGATPFMTVLAAYQALLGRHHGQDDFAVGTASAGRDQPELERLVGMFVNMVVLRAPLSGDPTFTELLSRVRETTLAAFAHRALPFEQLVHALEVPRALSRSPLCQATFMLHNYRAGENAIPRDDAPADGRWWQPRLPASRFELELHATTDGAGMACVFAFNTAVFTQDTVRRLATRLVSLLRAVVATPDRRLSELAY